MTLLAASTNSGDNPDLPVPGLGVPTEQFRPAPLPAEPKAKKRKSDQAFSQKMSKKVRLKLYKVICDWLARV